MQRGPIQSTPLAVTHAMRLHPHSRAAQLADHFSVKETGLTDPGSDDEERRLQSSLTQLRQRDLVIGFVAIVEGQPDVATPRRGIEHRAKAVAGDPHLLLAGLQSTWRVTDPVEDEDEDPAAHPLSISSLR